MELKTKFISQNCLGHGVHVSAHSEHAGIPATTFAWIFISEICDFLNGISSDFFFCFHSCMFKDTFALWEVDLVNTYLSGNAIYIAHATCHNPCNQQIFVYSLC